MLADFNYLVSEVSYFMLVVTKIYQFTKRTTNINTQPILMWYPGQLRSPLIISCSIYIIKYFVKHNCFFEQQALIAESRFKIIMLSHKKGIPIKFRRPNHDVYVVRSSHMRAVMFCHPLILSGIHKCIKRPSIPWAWSKMATIFAENIFKCIFVNDNV